MTEPTTVDTSAAAIAAVMEDVTAGPWTDEPGNIDDAEDYSVDRDDDNESGLCWSGVGNSVSTVALVVVPSSFGMDEEQAATARFIAWCREGVPALSAQLTAETARADAAESDVKAVLEREAASCIRLDEKVHKLKDERDALRAAIIGLTPSLCARSGNCWCGFLRDESQGHEPSCIAARAATEGKPL